jgi:hypothetical protein
LSGPTRRGLFVILAVALFVVPVLGGDGPVHAATSRAAVVVQHGDVVMKTACVTFEEPQITSYQALQRSGISFLAAHFDQGHTVCWLDGEGCKTTSPSDCFSCDQIRSWSLWTQDDGDSLPQPSSVGVDGRTMKDGSVDYWVWGPFGEPPIQATTVGAVCPAAARAPSATPVSTPSGSKSAPATHAPPEVAGVSVPLPATR